MNILITGTSSGLGKEIFNELKKDKKNFFFLVNRKSKNNSKNVKNYNVNLSNHRLLKNKIKKIITDSNKRIDLIICNAAQGVFGYLDEIKIKEFKNDMDVNFYSHLLIIKSFLPFMKKNRYGNIINISSGAGIVGLKKSSSYSVSKSCMQILIESIHYELIKYNIYSKNIFPGPTKTNFTKKNKYIKHKVNMVGENVNKISKIVIKNLFKKKINIFCQKKTFGAFLIKTFPNLK
jgi:3-hydroxy acid dehydrogenase/malonic semialdehyde reductase